jgi:hypothetical protein
VEKAPKTKEEIERLIIAELRTFSDCETALGVVVVAIADYTDTDATTWTVSSFDCGKSDGYACDRALQRIVPQFQRAYDMVQKH